MMVTFTLRVDRDAVVHERQGTRLSRVRQFVTVWARHAVAGGEQEGVFVVHRDATRSSWELRGFGGVVVGA